MANRESGNSMCVFIRCRIDINGWEKGKEEILEGHVILSMEC